MTEPGGKRVAIVGAGLAGLAAGTLLSARGYEVQIFEAMDRPGGRALTLDRPDGSGDRVDIGTQYFHTSYRRARALIAEAGLSDDLRRIKGRTRFFDDRAPGGTFTTGHRVPYIRAGGPWANLKLTLRGLARLALNPIETFAVRSYPRLDRQSVGDAVSDPFEWDFTARTLIAAGALIEPEGHEVSYLHLIRLMRIVLMTDYLSLAGGTAALHQALAKRLSITYGAPVTGLLGDGAVRGIALADGTEQWADQTILAVPPGALAGLLPPDWQQDRAFLEAIHHPPAVIVTLWLDRPLEPGIWSYVFPQGSGMVSFCTDATEKNPDMVPSRRAALQAWICWPSSGPAMAMDDAALTAAVTEELSRHLPVIKERIDSVHIQRHRHAVPQTGLRHSEQAAAFLARIDARDGVQICGDFLSGGYMECTLWSAERAFRQILAATRDGG